VRDPHSNGLPACAGRSKFSSAILLALLTAGACTLGCGGGGVGPVAPPPPPPPSISVSVAPSSATVLLGLTQQFTASVTGTSDTGVTWLVNNVPGGNSTLGTIDAQGMYTAPPNLPSPATLQITAKSQADSSKSASAQLTLASDISITVSPPAANVELGAALRFSATLTSAGKPNIAVQWTLSGAACPTSCGSIDAAGNYTAPPNLPVVPTVTVVATSIADPSRHAEATIQLTSSFTLSLSGPSSVSTGATAQFTATLSPAPNSNPNPAVSWSLSGVGCSGSSCGSVTSAGTAPGPGGATNSFANYTAPAVALTPPSVTLTATSVADPSKRASLAISITQAVSVSLSPSSATRDVNHRLTLSVQVNGTSNSTVTWSVNGIAGGNSSVGQICALASSPCQALTTSSAPQVDYVAPATLPTPNPVTVQAVSQADPSKSATAQITVIAHIVVAVTPSSVTLAPRATQQFAAAVTGTDNQNVVWQVQGSACASQPCGSIDSSGLYTAPLAAPSPNSIQVVATSSEDTQQSGSASVTITSGPSILTLLPASVFAGAASGFTLKVQGSGFVASAPGPGSVLVLNGAARTTTCSSTVECTAPLSSTDVAAPGNLTVQIRNPDNSSSNQVSLVVVAPSTADDVVSLSAAAPSASNKDIVVVEPSTAGISLPGADVDLDIAALGPFSSATNSCTLAGNTVVLVRPASGTVTADICVFASSGLDASMNYVVSGPADVMVISKQPAGLGIIHLTLEVPSTASPGPRSLFIENSNKDKAAATGALEVK
jgi:hypothetical protein